MTHDAGIERGDETTLCKDLRFQANINDIWQISTNIAQDEVIASNGRATLLLTGAAATITLAQGHPPQQQGREGIKWPLDSRILSDVAFSTATSIWQNSAQLQEALTSSKQHSYLLCAQKINELDRVSLVNIRYHDFTPILMYGSQIIVGPTVRQGYSPCLSCWIRRLELNTPSLATRLKRAHQLRPPSEEVLMRSMAAIRLLWEAPHPSSGPNDSLVINLEQGIYTRERPMPFDDCYCSTTHSETGIPTVGRFHGIISDLSAPPNALYGLPATVAVSSAHGQKAIGAAVSLDIGIARYRALCEGIEHLAAASPTHIAYQGPASSLPQISCENFWPYQDEQYESADFPWKRLTPDMPVTWVRAQRWIDGTQSYLPATLVTLIPDLNEPLLQERRSNGMATGSSIPAARLRALLEVAERDIIMRRWFERQVTQIDPTWLTPVILERLRQQGLSLRLWGCPNQWNLPVMVAWVGSSDTQIGAFGCAAKLTMADAAEHAAEEAALMYIRRRQRQTLLPWPCDLSSTTQFSTPHEDAAHINQLINDYDPWIVDLTTRSAAANGFRVASVFSTHATNFIGAEEAIPRRRWTPSLDAGRRLRSEPSAFLDD